MVLRMLSPLVVGIVSLALASPALAQPGHDSSSGQGQAARSEHVRRGVDHFDKAFYDLTPHGRKAEASREFDLAIAEFEGEVAANPKDVVALRYLGRIDGLRNEFKQAAGYYDRVAALEPLDPDACVFAALWYAEDGQLAESRARLEMAKGRTSDPAALEKIDAYLAKLDAAERRR